MPVENKYTDAATVAGNTAEPGANAQEIVRMVGYATVAAADDDGSVYRVFKNVPSSFHPQRITVMCSAITGGTDYELGIYNTDLGGVVNKGLFMTGQTLATASRVIDGMAAVSLPNIGNKATIAELFSLTPTTARSSYDIALTADTVGTAAGDIVVIMEGFAS